MARIYGKSTYFDTTAVNEAIKKCNVPKGKLSKMVLGAADSYLSNALVEGKMNEELLKKLCAFLSLDFEKVVVVIEDVPKKVPEQKEVAPTPSANSQQLDILIVGLNQIYDMMKLQNECLTNILEQMKIANTRIKRMESTESEVIKNVILTKNVITDAHNSIRDIKSSTATINGRVRDLLNKELQKGE